MIQTLAWTLLLASTFLIQLVYYRWACIKIEALEDRLAGLQHQIYSLQGVVIEISEKTDEQLDQIQLLINDIPKNRTYTRKKAD